MVIETKLSEARNDTADALHYFQLLEAQGATVSKVANIRRILCGVTSKLTRIELELALEEERKRL